MEHRIVVSNNAQSEEEALVCGYMILDSDLMSTLDTFLGKYIVSFHLGRLLKAKILDF